MSKKQSSQTKSSSSALVSYVITDGSKFVSISPETSSISLVASVHKAHVYSSRSVALNACRSLPTSLRNVFKRASPQPLSHFIQGNASGNVSLPHTDTTLNIRHPTSSQRGCAGNVSQTCISVSNAQQFQSTHTIDTKKPNKSIQSVSCASAIGQKFRELRDVMSKQQDGLNKQLSEVDKEICDIRHYIEFNRLNAADGFKAYQMLRDCLLRRRTVKDELYRIMLFQRIEIQSACDDFDSVWSEVQRNVEERVYKPRVLVGLFE